MGGDARVSLSTQPCSSERLYETSRARSWQVLPGRTHPVMTAKGGAEGYVFTGWRTKPAEGQGRGEGKFKKKKVNVFSAGGLETAETTETLPSRRAWHGGIRSSRDSCDDQRHRGWVTAGHVRHVHRSCECKNQEQHIACDSLVHLSLGLFQVLRLSSILAATGMCSPRTSCNVS